MIADYADDVDLGNGTDVERSAFAMIKEVGLPAAAVKAIHQRYGRMSPSRQRERELCWLTFDLWSMPEPLRNGKVVLGSISGRWQRGSRVAAREGFSPEQALVIARGMDALTRPLG